MPKLKSDVLSGNAVFENDPHMPFDWIECRAKEKFRSSPGRSTWKEDNVDPYLEEEEAKHMRYTPVYCLRPVDLSTSGYRLRCVEVGRRPKVMVCITMYNEGPQQLQATLESLAINLTYIEEKQKEDKKVLKETFAGDDIWKNVLVCIVADGREQINNETLDYLETIGLYDEDVLSTNMEAQCHLFENTLQLFVNEKSMLPIQTVFVLKENKSGKLDSHYWYFTVFVEQIQPEYTAVIDVGTMLNKPAMYNLLSAFEQNHQIGGACGQLTVDKPFENLTNWVVSAQHFEYNISNILDKSLESCFGFISVLPGAFSAYRYEAIRGAPLDAYFQTLNVDLDVLGPFVGNMYLAEDRILTFEVVARKDCRWTLHYVRDAVARTDVPHDLVALISQRKRWLNGAFFSTLFSIWNWGRIYSESSHSFLRKLAFLFFYLYHLLFTAFSFFLPANLYLALYFIVFQGFQQNRLGFIDTYGYPRATLDSAVYIYNILYILALLMLIIISLGNNPKHMKLTYNSVMVAYGLMMMLSLIVGAGIFFSNLASTELIVVSVLTVGVYFIGPALHGKVHHIFLTVVQFTAFIPTFTNILTIYSFCNLQDLSWGTKGLHDNPLLALQDEAEKNNLKDKRRALECRRREESEREDYKKEVFEAFRTNILCTWALTNVSFVLFIVYLSDCYSYMPVLTIFVVTINSCRLLGCIGHWSYIQTAWLRYHIFDKSQYGNNMGSHQKNLNVQMDDHYIAVKEEQHTFASECS